MTQQGVLKSSVEADKPLFTLKLPAQPQLGAEFIEPSEVQILVFSEGRASYRGIRNAFDLLDVLYERGVTDRAVLEVLLEATGHRKVEVGPDEDRPQNASEGQPDHAR